MAWRPAPTWQGWGSSRQSSLCCPVKQRRNPDKGVQDHSVQRSRKQTQPYKYPQLLHTQQVPARQQPRGSLDLAGIPPLSASSGKQGTREGTTVKCSHRTAETEAPPTQPPLLTSEFQAAPHRGGNDHQQACWEKMVSGVKNQRHAGKSGEL